MILFTMTAAKSPLCGRSTDEVPGATSSVSSLPRPRAAARSATAAWGRGAEAPRQVQPARTYLWFSPGQEEAEENEVNFAQALGLPEDPEATQSSVRPQSAARHLTTRCQVLKLHCGPAADFLANTYKHIFT